MNAASSASQGPGPRGSKVVAELEDRDVVSQLTRGFRLDSAVLCRSVMSVPWGFAVAGREAGSFHAVLAGGGWLEIDGLSDPIYLRAGDVAILPRGDGHRVSDARDSAAPMLAAILADKELRNGELRFGGEQGPVTEIVCGVFGVEGNAPGWFAALPPVVVAAASSPGGSWRSALVAAMRDELGASGPGGMGVVSRWLESILADALRRDLAARSKGDPMIAAAIADERIGRVLARIHEDPAGRWTLSRLAGLAAMSRSSFASRFRAVVNEPPVRHVTRIRLDKAERLLNGTDLTVAEIARRVGYASEEALSRAFKARFGVPPSVRRRDGRASTGPAQD